jgi:transposase
LASITTGWKDTRPIKLWVEDEARFGRMNKLSYCWVPGNERAEIEKQLIREYTYAYTAVCPQTGEVYSIQSPYNNTLAMNAFLQAFSQQYKQHRIILTLDGAGWHKSKDLLLPENIRLLFLPPYSPQLNPVEHIWDYMREQKHFNNYSFDSIEDVEYRLVKVLLQLTTEKSILKSLCNFNWMDY